jgi:hypothetical protein
MAYSFGAEKECNFPENIDGRITWNLKLLTFFHINFPKTPHCCSKDGQSIPGACLPPRSDLAEQLSTDLYA